MVSYLTQIQQSSTYQMMVPYMKLARMDRPTGWWLLLWPALWSVALASSGSISPLHMILFSVGAIVMRGAGCTFNDIIDREYDAKVERTKTRPLAAGDLTVQQAMYFLVGQVFLSALIVLQMNGLTVLLSFVSLALVGIYPYMKRWTYWPQAVLGLAFNWGALLGWTAVTGSLGLPAFFLYAAGFFWTMGYDTIYGHQDTKDDAALGLKSTSLKFGEHTYLWVSGFYGAFITCTLLAGLLSGLGTVFLLSLGVLAGQLLWQIQTLDIKNPNDCLEKFKSNRWVGLIIFAGIFLDSLY